MPILDPSLAYYLCTKIQQYTPVKIKNFFAHYLKIAVNNYDRSFQSFNNSIQFRTTLREISLDLFNKFLGTDIQQKKLFSLKNAFEFLYSKISDKKYSELEGCYLFYKNVFRINLFQLYTEFSFFRSWYFIDNPIAILCILCQTK